MSLPAAFGCKTVESTCTVWIGATNSKGYGLVWLDGDARLAHRVAYENAHGQIPAGMVVDHLCRVRNCVRVDHLELVTVGENTRRGRVAGGLSAGETCINGHELTDGDIYTRPNGVTECRKCRGGDSPRDGRRRPSTRKRSSEYAAAHLP